MGIAGQTRHVHVVSVVLGSVRLFTAVFMPYRPRMHVCIAHSPLHDSSLVVETRAIKCLIGFNINRLPCMLHLPFFPCFKPARRGCRVFVHSTTASVFRE